MDNLHDGKLRWFKMHDGNGTPTPPIELTEWRESREVHLCSGERNANNITQILKQNNINLADIKRFLDFGCSNCRVLRHFINHAEPLELWGADIQTNKIFWAMENLPELNLIVNSVAPPLPFKDGYFGLVFSGSAFTHLVDYHTAWIAEFARIIKPGGYALFSVHDEISHHHMVDAKTGVLKKWGPDVLTPIQKDEELYVKFCNFDYFNYGAYYTGSAQSFTFMSKRYIKKITASFFELLAVTADVYDNWQTAYLFRRKPDIEQQLPLGIQI